VYPGGTEDEARIMTPFVLLAMEYLILFWIACLLGEDDRP